MTAPFEVGSVVWVRPRLPEFRQQGWHPAACYPATVLTCEPAPRYIGDPPDAVRCSNLTVEPCGVPGTKVLLHTDRDNVATEPCDACAEAWTAAGWQQLREVAALVG